MHLKRPVLDLTAAYYFASAMSSPALDDRRVIRPGGQGDELGKTVVVADDIGGQTWGIYPLLNDFIRQRSVGLLLLGRGRDEAQPAGSGYCCAPVVDAQFLIDVAQVGFDGVGLLLRQQFQDL
jgi:hypothetical protein